MAYKEIRKPDDYTDHATQSTNPERAWDKCGRAEELALWGVTNISVDATPSLTYHTWQPKIESVFYSVDLYLMWKTSLQTGDDEFGIEYTYNGGSTWHDLVPMGVNRSDTWVKETVELDKNQDLSKIEVRVNTKLVGGADNIDLYLGDIWTASLFTTPIIVTLQKDLSLETPPVISLRNVAGITSRSAVVGGADRGQIWRTEDVGETWTFVQELWDGATSRGKYIEDIIRMTDKILLCATGQKGEIWKSNNAGLTWVSQRYWDPNPHTINALARLSDTVALAIDSDLTTHKSIDAGSTWTEEDTTDIVAAGASRVWAMEPINSTSALCGVEQSGVVMKTTDSGANWTVVLDLGSLIESDDIISICVISNDIYLIGSEYNAQIWRTIDGGENWTKVISFEPTEVWCPYQSGVQSLYYMGGGVVLAGTATWAQLWWSRDYGLTWKRVAQLKDEYASTGFIFDIGQMGSTVFMGTGGLGQIWQTVLPILAGSQGDGGIGVVNEGFGGFGF